MVNLINLHRSWLLYFKIYPVLQQIYVRKDNTRSNLCPHNGSQIIIKIFLLYHYK